MSEVKTDMEEVRSKIAREELINYINRLGDVELQIVADTIPVDLCVARIQKELRRKELMENAMAAATELMKTV